MGKEDKLKLEKATGITLDEVFRKVEEIFSAPNNSSAVKIDSETKRFLKMGLLNLYFNYFNHHRKEGEFTKEKVVPDHNENMDISKEKSHENEKEKERIEKLLRLASDLHLCFITCNYASTEHLSLLHVCYEWSKHLDGPNSKKSRFWALQLQKLHLLRYGNFDNDLNKILMCMSHTKKVL